MTALALLVGVFGTMLLWAGTTNRDPVAELRAAIRGEASPGPKAPLASPDVATSATVAGSPTAAGFANPVPGATCSSPFGENRSGGPHQGLDLAAPAGTPVGAIAAGTVTYAGAAGTCGITVDVEHGSDVRSRYCHLRRVSVQVGQRVTAGTEVGEVGSTGNSTGPHLHLEVTRGATRVDPGPLIGVSC